MVVLFKEIKPTRLRDDKIRLTLLNAMRKQGTANKKDLEEATGTWEHKPKFETLVSLADGGATVVTDTTTESEIFRWVNEGTPPHDIWAGIYTGKSKATVLAIPTMFKPKTVPGRLKAGKGSRSKSKYFRPYVRHPGTKPRDITGQVAKRQAKPYKRRMEKAMKVSARVSGHGV